MKQRVTCAALVSLATAASAIVMSAQQPGAESQTPRMVSTISLDERGLPTARTIDGRPTHHPGRVLVRFRTGARRDLLAGSPSARSFAGDPNLFVVGNPPGLSVADALRSYHANPNVLFAEPDYVVTTNVTPHGSAVESAVGHDEDFCPHGLEHSNGFERGGRGDHRHGDRFHAPGPSRQPVGEL